MTGSTVSWSLLKFMSIESVILSNHLILCHPLILLPSIFPNIKVFWNESALLIRWPKCWSFSFSIIPSSEYSGLISFSTDCLIFKSKGNQSNWIQEISPEFFNFSHPYTTTGKNIASKGKQIFIVIPFPDTIFAFCQQSSEDAIDWLLPHTSRSTWIIWVHPHLNPNPKNKFYFNNKFIEI